MSISSREAAVVVEGPQKTNEKSENVAEPDSLGAKLKPT